MTADVGIALDFGAALPALEGVLNTISGIPGTGTTLSTQPFRFPQIGTGVLPDGSTGINGRARLTLEIMSAIGWGRDERRRFYNSALRPAGDTYAGPGAPLGGVVVELTGNRELVVQVTCESWDVRNASVAQSYIEKIRTRIYLPTVHDALDAVGLALREISRSHTASYDDENGNRIDCAICELTFNAADAASDDPITTIESISGFTVVPTF